MAQLLSYTELNAYLGRYMEHPERALRFVAENDKGQIRIGAYDRETGWYVEVSNFQELPSTAGVDYCDADEEIEGLFRFYMEAEASDYTGGTEGIMSMTYEHAATAVYA